MKVEFIHHSSYLVNLEDNVIIFDYTEGELDLPKEKNIYFIVTHGHLDHFTSDIFQYKDQAKYLISTHVEDIDKTSHHIMIKPGEVKKMDDLSFHAFGSTDEGISIVVKCEGKTIYHSGDLNFWLWPTYMAEDIANMAQEFMDEVDKAKSLMPFDIVMGVVDPRMGDYYHLSGQYFIKTLEPKHFFPLHLWKDFGLSKTFAQRFNSDFPDTEIHSVNEDGQVFII